MKLGKLDFADAEEEHAHAKRKLRNEAFRRQLKETKAARLASRHLALATTAAVSAWMFAIVRYFG